jgi:hypothetical protein
LGVREADQEGRRELENVVRQDCVERMREFMGRMREFRWDGTQVL